MSTFGFSINHYGKPCPGMNTFQIGMNTFQIGMDSFQIGMNSFQVEMNNFVIDASMMLATNPQNS